jgi:predicted  nucleic acid-binding Zn-ribbon protein
MTGEPKKSGAAVTPLKVLDHLRRDIGKAEREIAKLDARKAEIETIFADPAVYADGAQVKALQDELATIASRTHELMSSWEALTMRLEALESA